MVLLDGLKELKLGDLETKNEFNFIDSFQSIDLNDGNVDIYSSLDLTCEYFFFIDVHLPKIFLSSI